MVRFESLPCGLRTGFMAMRSGWCRFAMRSAVPVLTTLVLFFAGWVEAGRAQTAYPMLMSLEPVAAQAGQTSEHTVKSRYNLYGAYQVLVTGTGVTGEVIPPEVKEGETPNLQSIKLRFTVAPDAEPGVRDFRLATPQGASTLGQLVITTAPVFVEQGKNDTRETAQAVAIPQTVCGAIEQAEDVDVFRFTAQAGQALSFHVRSMRLQDRIHDLQQHVDPIIELKNAQGSTLAACDNFYFGDPFLHHRFELAGDYYIQIRDVRFQGNAYWQYSIEITDRPLITNLHPLGIAAGQTARLELVSYPPMTTPTFLQVQAREAVPMPTSSLFSSALSLAPLVVSDLPVVLERDGENGSPDQAVRVTLPVGVSGRIESDSDVDCYRFVAMKGERYSFEVQARRQESRLDSHLRILDLQGKQLALNDDLRRGRRTYADSWIENWTVPADGEYVIEIRDLHLRGGADFVYFIRAERTQPLFELYADTDKTQLTPGTSGVIYVRSIRKYGFDGEIQLGIRGLPAGVTATCGKILTGKGEDGCIVLTAAPDATLAAANVEIYGMANWTQPGGATQTLTAVAESYQETYQPGGGRGHWPVQMHTVAIGALSDIRKVELSDYEITLKPGESKRIEVKLQRADGFDKNVTLDMTYNHLSQIFGNSLPPGVTIDSKNSQTLLTGTNSTGHITLTAAADAAVADRQLACVMANVSLNFVMKSTYASTPVWITVVKE